jgi:cobalamin biosynthesis protein CobD/CbiB
MTSMLAGCEAFDIMWGYHNERDEQLSKATARLEDD